MSEISEEENRITYSTHEVTVNNRIICEKEGDI